MMKHSRLFLIGFLCLAACSPISSKDQEATSSSSIIGKQPDEPLAIPSASPNASLDLFSNQNSSIADTEKPVVAASTALLQEIQGLVAQRRVDLVPSTPGWLHLIIRHTRQKAEPLLSGDNASGQIQQEQWLFLDERGLVRADIRRTLNSQEPAGSLALWTTDEWVNLPLVANDAASSRLPFDPNYGIYELLTHLVGQGKSLNKSTIYKDCWYQGEKYMVSDGRTMNEVLFRPDYGALRWIKTWQISSGVLTLVDSLEIALEERLPQAPAEILALAGQ